MLQPHSLSPNWLLVRGMSNSFVVAERRLRCPVIDEIDVVLSDRYAELEPLLTLAHIFVFSLLLCSNVKTAK